MTAPVPSFANDDQAAQHWLALLRSGTDDQKIQAREQLATIFERRRMFEEATDLLVSNARAGVQDADIFRWLARLYRAQGDEVTAMQAAAEAAKYVLVDMPPLTAPPPAPPEPIPGQPYAVQHRSSGTSGCLKLAVAMACLTVFGTLGLIIFGVALGTLSDARLVSQTPPVGSAPARVGKAEVNLGVRSFGFGSQGQARELLAVMDRQPGKNEYSITYDTGEDTVAFGCNFDTGVLARIHVSRTGRGSKETWRGSIVERLRSASGGGSLNDTPAGKGFVTREDL